MLNTTKLLEDIRKDPAKNFYDKVLGCSHYNIQDEITESVFNNQRTTVKSCHGSGKSYTAARVGMAFMFAFPNSVVITTAPTFRQVEDVIWREFRVAHSTSKIDLGGTLLNTRYDIGPKWYAKGISSDKSDNVQGYHADHLLVIVDEAAGVAKDILDAIQGLLTSESVHLLYIGNPTAGVGSFYDSFKSSMFNKISISVFDTPNFKINNLKTVADLKKFKTRDEIASLPLEYPQLVTPLWAWERLEDWGEDSPIFKARVLAEFPEEGDDTLIGLHLVEQALRKEYTPFDFKEWGLKPRSIGIDVARYGDNMTVMTAMHRYQHLDTKWHQGKDLMQTAGMAIKFFNDMGFEKRRDRFVVDDTGLGGGVTDALSEQGYNVIPVNFGSSSTEDLFMNIKAEMFWNLRQLFRDDLIAIKDIGKLIAQLPTVKYKYTSQGKLQMVEKEKMKAEGLESPDFADSLALACWGGAMQREGKIWSGDSPGGNTLAGNLMKAKF